jgi:hypothetical protein
MRLLLLLCALVLLSTVTTACGGGGATVVRERALGPTGHEDADGDYDFKPLAGDYGRVAEEQDRRAATAVANGSRNTHEVELAQSGVLDGDNDKDNHQAILAYGQPADAIDQHAVARTIKRYYAAAARRNTRAACALLLPSLAVQLAHEYGHTRYLHGGSCAAVESHLFARLHAELLGDRDTLEVLRARVHTDVAVALLAWSETSREGQIALRREHGAWRLAGLIDGPRPLDGEAR